MPRQKEIIDLSEFSIPETKIEPTRKEKAILKKQAQLFETAVSIGKCSECDLKDTCPYANDTDTICRASNAAIEYFEKQAFKLPHIQPADSIGVRSLAAIYASCFIAQLYFQKEGSIGWKFSADGSAQRAFKELHNQYMRLQKLLQDGLAQYGMTPMGRKNITQHVKDPLGGQNSLSIYLNANYSKSGEKVIAQKRQELPEPNILDETFDYQPLIISEGQDGTKPKKEN